VTEAQWAELFGRIELADQELILAAKLLPPAGGGRLNAIRNSLVDYRLGTLQPTAARLLGPERAGHLSSGGEL
jgi:hypothetical protein